MVERPLSMREVGGSIPLISNKIEQLYKEVSTTTQCRTPNHHINPGQKNIG